MSQLSHCSGIWGEIRPGGNLHEKDKVSFDYLLSLINFHHYLGAPFPVLKCLTKAASMATDGKLQDKTCGDATLHALARREIKPGGSLL